MDLLNDVDTDQCSICFCELGDDENLIYTVPGCNHKFHTNCIIPWYRASDGSCPYCRSNDNNGHWTHYISSRANIVSTWKRLARRKECPDFIKKKCAKITTAKRESEQCSKDKTKFRKENKNVIDAYSKLRRKHWDKRRKHRMLERELLDLPQQIMLRLLSLRGFS